MTYSSDGRMIRLETLIELKINSSFSSFSSHGIIDRQFPVERPEATVSRSTAPSPPLNRLTTASPLGSSDGGAPAGAAASPVAVAAAAAACH